MFVTDASWREPSPVKKSLVHPMEAWRLVGITPETPIFLVQTMNFAVDDTTIVRTFLVGSVELLLQLLDQATAQTPLNLRVHVIQETELEEVHELWEYQSGCKQNQRLYAYVGPDGGLKPYYSWQKLPAMDWPRVKLARFGKAAV